MPKDEGRDFEPRTLRIFEAGHRGEDIVADWLRLAGFDLRTERADGRQFGFSALDGRFKGHIDGCLVAGPVPLAYPALWENKALGAASWKDVVKRGLTLSKPVYAAQIALYQAYLELPNPALFTALNRDTMELYSELVPFDPSLAQTMSDRAVEVVRVERRPGAAAAGRAGADLGALPRRPQRRRVARRLRLAGPLLGSRGMIPEAYDLKRVVARHWQRFWCGEELRGLVAAPVYHFADQEPFDSDAVEMAGRRLSAGPLRLPHRRVVFEVADRGEDRRALVAYAWETEAGVEAVLLTRLRALPALDRRAGAGALPRRRLGRGRRQPARRAARRRRSLRPLPDRHGLAVAGDPRRGRHDDRADGLQGAPPEARRRRYPRLDLASGRDRARAPGPALRAAGRNPRQPPLARPTRPLAATR